MASPLFLQNSSAIFYEGLLENSPVGICLIQDDRFCYVNKAFAGIYGYDAREMIGHSCLLGLDRRNEDSPAIHIWKQVGADGMSPYDCILQDRNGRLRSVRLLAQQIECQGKPALLGNIIDVTELKQNALTLIKDNAALQAILDEAPIGIYMTHKNNPQLFYINQHFTSLFGYTMQDIPTVHDWRIKAYPDEDYRKSIALDHNALPSHVASNVWITCKDGSRRRVSRAWTMTADYVVVTYTDITELDKIQAEIARHAEELARSNNELEQFAYVASHDLQEPLRMIASYTMLLGKRYKGKLDPDADEFIGYAVDGANRMKRLIDDLLTFSRVGSRGKAPKPANSEAALQQALSNLSLVIEEQQARITYTELPLLMADESQLVQLFQNLIANAIKFRSAALPQVHITAELKGNEWDFSVQDNGIGIAPEYFERIFLIFQRLHKKTEYTGTGIGLAICKRIVERHGGQIWVESVPGCGSAFHFTFPLSGGNRK